MKIGLISDTHGLLREEVVGYLKGCDMILHAGDINHLEIVNRLEALAPLKVVKGNNDKGEWAEALPLYEQFRIGDYRFYMVHQKKDVPKDLTDIDVVIIGHSHRYSDSLENGMRFLNPGSCGKRRFDLPITMMIMTLEKNQLKVQQIALDPTKM